MATSRPRSRSSPSCSAIGLRVGVEVEQTTATLHRGGEIPKVFETKHGADVIGLRGQLGHARAVGQAQRAAVGRALDLFDARHRTRGEELDDRVTIERSAARQPQHDHTGRCEVAAASRLAHLAGCDREDLADRVVELADAREARRERDVREWQLGRLDQHAGALGALRTSERDRTRADLGGQLAVQVPLAVPEPLAELGDAPAVDDAVRDQAHRAPDQIGSHVPLG